MKIAACCGLTILTLAHPLLFDPSTATYTHPETCPMPPLDALAAALTAHADRFYARMEFDRQRKRFAVEICQGEEMNADAIADGAGPTLGAAIEGALAHLESVLAEDPR